MHAEITLSLHESADLPEGVALIDPADMTRLGLSHDGYVTLISPNRFYYAKIQPSHLEDRNQGLVVIASPVMEALGLAEGNNVRIGVLQTPPSYAETITLTTDDDIDYLYLAARIKRLTSAWRDRIVVLGDSVCLSTTDHIPLMARISVTNPAGPVLIGSGTVFMLEPPVIDALDVPLGGAREIYRICNDLAMRRLKSNVTPQTKSILLTGPVGCGKAQLVRRLAEEAKVHLRQIDTHHLLDHAIGGDPLDLENLFSNLTHISPVIILLDNLEALDQHPAQHHVLTQLCALLDELRLHPGILLFGICSGEPNPRLLSGQRFDLVLTLDAPDRLSRLEILHAATRSFTLADDVDLNRLALMTRGYTASDLTRLANMAMLAKPSDSVAQKDFITAMRSIAPSAASYVYCDQPDVLLDDIGGLDDAKALLIESLSWSFARQQAFIDAGVRAPRSILLSGGTGTGKTSLVRALAHDMPMNFVEVSCPSLATRNDVEAHRFIRDCFALAQRKAPCLVFFDDVDVLFKDNGDGLDDSSSPHPSIPRLLAEMDLLHERPGIVLIAATSRPDRLTDEMMRAGRFDYALSLPMPDKEARKKILHIHSRRLPLASDIDLDQLAEAMGPLSPADIATICNRVGMLALRQSFEAKNVGIPPSVTAPMFEQILRGRKS